MNRVTDSILTLQVQFKLLDEDVRVPPAETVMYRTYPVLETESNWREDITTEYQRDIEIIDFLTGGVLVDDTSDVSTRVHKYHWQGGSRTQVNAIRNFLFSRYGRLVPVWVPSFSEDLQLIAQVGAGVNRLMVTNTNYTRNVASAVQRRDIRIVLKNGSIFYRRIASSAELVGGEELALNDALGVLVNPEDVKEIGFMSLCRLESDAVEIRWETDSIAESSTMFRTIRDDVA